MLARFGRLMAVAVAAVSVVQAAPATTQPIPPPPLLPGELLAPLSNCTIVVREPPNLSESREAWLQRYRTFHWRGTCRNGLAHGRGVLTFTHEGRDYPMEPTEAVYGRFFGVSRHQGVAPGYFRISYTALDGRSGSIDQVTEPFKPVWGRPSSQVSDFHSSVYAPGGRWVTAFTNICHALKDQLRDCTGDNYNVYGIMMSDGRSSQSTTVWCPDPKSPASCEALWRQYVDPLAAEIEALKVEVERDTPAWRERVAALNAPREAQIAALETARVEAAARERAEIAAAAEAEEKAFQDRLARGTAGQLFALADEMSEAGDVSRQRQVLRTLVSRFPDHALAANAAQQLSQMSSPGGAASASAAPSYSRPAPAGAASRAPSSGVNEAACKAEVERLAGVLNASQPRNAGNSVRQMETLMFVLKAMADATDAMCPRTQAYIDASAGFRKTYNDTARTCGQVSSQGACTPRLH